MDSSSERRHDRPLRGPSLPFLSATLACAVVVAHPADATVFHSQQEALKIAFPTADRIEQQTYILTPAQAAEIARQARSELESKLVTIYTGWLGDAVLGYAHIDVHTVRTKPEGFMVVLDKDGRVRSLRVLAFHEPLDYLPGGRWYEQFDGKSLEDDLRVGGDIHGIVGATLSARAATASVRRALAVHRVLIGSN